MDNIKQRRPSSPSGFRLKRITNVCRRVRIGASNTFGEAENLVRALPQSVCSFNRAPLFDLSQLGKESALIDRVYRLRTKIRKKITLHAREHVGGMNVAPAQLLICVPCASVSFERIAWVGSGEGSLASAGVYAIAKKTLRIVRASRACFSDIVG